MNGRLEAQDQELAKFLEELEQEAERQKSSAAELEKQQKLFTDLRAEYDTSCAQISELENTLVSVRKEKESASHELLQARAKATELEEFVATLRAEHSEAQKQALEKIEEIEKIKDKKVDDLALALRLQALREADVDELKTRYQSLKGENEHLISLVRRILHNLSFIQARKQSSKKSPKRV